MAYEQDDDYRVQRAQGYKGFVGVHVINTKDSRVYDLPEEKQRELAERNKAILEARKKEDEKVKEEIAAINNDLLIKKQISIEVREEKDRKYLLGCKKRIAKILDDLEFFKDDAEMTIHFNNKLAKERSKFFRLKKKYPYVIL